MTLPSNVPIYKTFLDHRWNWQKKLTFENSIKLLQFSEWTIKSDFSVFSVLKIHFLHIDVHSLFQVSTIPWRICTTISPQTYLLLLLPCPVCPVNWNSAFQTHLLKSIFVQVSNDVFWFCEVGEVFEVIVIKHKSENKLARFFQKEKKKKYKVYSFT